MNTLMFSPRWFFDYDIVFDVLSALVTLIIAFYAHRLSKYDNSTRYKYFSVSFLMIGLSFIGKALTNFVIYHPIKVSKTFGFLTVNYSTHSISHVPFVLGFFVHRSLLLLGLVGIYIVLTKFKEHLNSRSGTHHLVLLGLLILTITIFSWSAYYIFHFISLILLYFIFYEYKELYKKKKKTQTYLICWSFLSLIASQLMFMFVFITPVFYFLGEVLQLIGFLLLAYVFYNVLKS